MSDFITVLFGQRRRQLIVLGNTEFLLLKTGFTGLKRVCLGFCRSRDFCRNGRSGSETSGNEHQKYSAVRSVRTKDSVRWNDEVGNKPHPKSRKRNCRRASDKRGRCNVLYNKCSYQASGSFNRCPRIIRPIPHSVCFASALLTGSQSWRFHLRNLPKHLHLCSYQWCIFSVLDNYWLDSLCKKIDKSPHNKWNL